MGSPNGILKIINELKGLGTDKAIHLFMRQGIHISKVTHDGGSRVVMVIMQNLKSGYIPAILFAVGVFGNLQHTSLYMVGIGMKKFFDIISVNGGAPVKPKYFRNRFYTAEIRPVYTVRHAVIPFFSPLKNDMLYKNFELCKGP